MSKEKSIFGLEKIPDEALIGELRIELGKRNSYIQELEHELKSNNKRFRHQLKMANREINYYHLKMRIGSGKSSEFEKWIIENEIDTEQAKRLREIIKLNQED